MTDQKNKGLKGNHFILFLARSFQKSLWMFFVLVSVMGLMSACSSTSNDGAGANATASKTGKVALLFTDAPTDEFAEVNITITEATLLTEDDQNFTLFQGSRRVNLLALQEVEALFMIQEEVPVGKYHKIRLRVEAPEFVKKDGTVIPSAQIQLVAEGKIDLISREGFSVVAGETLMLRIDMDARASIQVHEADNFQYQFRPVVFVDVMADQSVRVLSLAGVIESIDTENKSFILSRVSHRDHDDDESEEHEGDHDDEDEQEHPGEANHTEDNDEAHEGGGGASGVSVAEVASLENEEHGGERNDDGEHAQDSYLIRVVVSEETVFVDVSGAVLDFAALSVDQKVQVRGVLNEEEDLSILAKLIEIGEPLHLEGTVTTDLADGVFGFTPEAGQALTEAITIAVNEDTLILKNAQVISFEDVSLLEGREIIVSLVGRDPYQATLILLRSNEDDDDEHDNPGEEEDDDGDHEDVGHVVSFETIAKGVLSGIETEQFKTITTSEAWAEFWALHAGADALLPSVNFETQMLIVAHSGTRPSGAYALEIKTIQADDGMLKIKTTESIPGEDCFVTMAISQPHHIVSINKTNATPQFIRTEEVVGCTVN